MKTLWNALRVEPVISQNGLNDFELNHRSQRRSDFEHVAALLMHLRMTWLLKHLPPRLVWSVYVGVNGFVTIGLLGLLALITGSPFVFPSLGPTAYLFFFSPLAEASSPRNAILGHAIGLVCGYAAFAGTSSFQWTFAAHGEVHLSKVLAAAFALSATGALMALLQVSHPPAGATTLIVALGIIYQPKEMIVIEIAVVLLTAQAFIINRMAGIYYPLWLTSGSLGSSSVKQT